MLCSEGNLSSSERQPFLRGLSLSILRHRIGRRGGRAPASTLHTSRSLALRRLRPKREAAPKPTVQCPHCHSFMNLVNVDEYLRTYSPRPFSTTPSARATRPPLKPRILIPSPPPSATDNANVSDDGTIADQSSIPEEHASAQVQSSEPESSPYPVTPHVASVASLSDAHQDSGSTPPIVDDSIFAAPAVQPQKSSGVLQSLSEHQHQQKRVSRASKARCLQLLNSIAREERSVESSSESSSDEEHHSELLHRPLLDSSRAAASSTRAPQRTATTRAAPQAPASFLGAGGVSSTSSSLYIAMPRAEEPLTIAARYCSNPMSAPRRHSSLRPDTVSSRTLTTFTGASGLRTQPVGAIGEQQSGVETAMNASSSPANNATTLQWLQSPSCCIPLEPLDMD